MKINEKGQVTIPKKLREKYNLSKGVDFEICEQDGSLIITPIHRCYYCKKAFTATITNQDACTECSQKERKTIYIY